jgi:hypothetical protein
MLRMGLDNLNRALSLRNIFFRRARDKWRLAIVAATHRSVHRRAEMTLANAVAGMSSFPLP